MQELIRAILGCVKPCEPLFWVGTLLSFKMWNLAVWILNGWRCGAYGTSLLWHIMKGNALWHAWVFSSCGMGVMAASGHRGLLNEWLSCWIYQA